MLRRFCPWLLLPLTLLLPGTLLAQLPVLGNIIGQIRIARGDPPSRQIIVELQLRGATVNSVYTDAQGHFGFNNLELNPYHIVINDEAYYPVDELVVVSPEAPNRIIQIILRPREDKKKDDPMGARAIGRQSVSGRSGRL